MKAKLLFFVALFIVVSAARADDLRGDTIDVHSYLMRLDFTNFTSKIFYADVTIGINAKMDSVTGIHLDLLLLTVDSVKVNSVITAFNYNDTLLNIGLPTLNTGDSATLEIFYYGHPIQPPGDFGGFYWSGSYAFNIGVSFLENPHNFGRIWFPCFDNFQVRSYYEYYITTPPTLFAYCNGALLDSTSTDSSNIWHWKLAENIPSYLADVTIGDFQTFYDTLQAMNGVIPYRRSSSTADTAIMNHYFGHLHLAFHNLESHWGPYQWERVGYCVVPYTLFDAGAMEHATNITFSDIFFVVAPYNEVGEQKVAHELSHHWFGDLVTCDSAAEMWLNEGWAVFNEYLFLETAYGEDSVRQDWRSNHQLVLQMAQIYDGAYLPVSGVPSANTYGTTVYQKGADVIHTLRYYLGDTLFFNCVQGYLNTYAHSNGSTALLRDYLSQCSGIDLTDYFNDWVLAKGFPHFSIKDYSVTPVGANYSVTVQIRQRLREAPQLYTNVPVKVSYFNWDMSRIIQTVNVSDSCDEYTTTLPYNPALICVDFDENLQDAISDEWQMIKDTGSYTFNIGMMDVHVNSMTADSVLLRIEHNWIAADPMYHPIPGLHLHNYRFWTVDGVFDSSFHADAVISYNGSTNAYLDSSFIHNSEDSLVMMYRPNQDSDWAFADSFYVNTEGSPLNKVGEINIYNLKKGQYSMAIWESTVPTDSNTAITCTLETGIKTLPEIPDFKIFPNPTNETATAIFESNVFTKLDLYDLVGRNIFEQKIPDLQSSAVLQLMNLAPGSYLLTLTAKEGEKATKQIIKQ